MATIELVLAPGLLCDARVWADQARDLADAAHITVAEYGDSDTLEAMARRLLAAAPQRFALAGHSMGGRVAMETLRLAPQRVLALGLFDTGVHALPEGEAGRRESASRHALLELARREGMRAMARRWVGGMVHASRRDDPSVIEPILDMFARRTPDVFAAQIRALLTRPDAAALLPTLGVPALVLVGREDQATPVEQHEAIAARIQRCRLVVVPDCGHMSMMEQPAAVTAALASWLAEIREG